MNKAHLTIESQRNKIRNNREPVAKCKYVTRTLEYYERQALRKSNLQLQTIN